MFLAIEKVPLFFARLFRQGSFNLLEIVYLLEVVVVSSFEVKLKNKSLSLLN